MSGAGKTSSIAVLEDFGYFCMDNVPGVLLKGITDMIKKQAIKEMVCVIDIRSISKFNGTSDFISILYELEELANIQIIFLDADDDALEYRYHKTRRAHPLQKNFSLSEAIKKERYMLRGLKDRADFVINTTGLDIKDLREEILSIANNKGFIVSPMRVEIQSFSFSKGVPHDANLVIDVRFLPNPYYAEDLINLTGKDKRVQDYIVDRYPQLDDFFDCVKCMAKNTIEGFASSGRNQLKIAVGCTGGQHRSVYLAERLYNNLKIDNANISISHREEKSHPLCSK